MNSDFFVAAPKIAVTPDLALYECLWACLLQPSSTTTVIAGTLPSKLLFDIANWFVFLLLAFSNCSLSSD